MEATPALPIEDDYSRESDDFALVQAARVEPEAFGEIYKLYVARIYRYLHARTGSEEDAADLTQQVFLQALAGLTKYHGEAPFAAWLFRIARNLVTDSYRRRREFVSWEVLPDTLRSAPENDPETTAIQRESLAQLRALFNTLSPEKRELLWLRFGAGLSVQEIATVIGKSPAAVRKQVSRTLQALEEQYDE